MVKKPFVVKIGEAVTSRVMAETKLDALVKVLKNRKLVSEKISINSPKKK